MDKTTAATALLSLGVLIISFSINERLAYALGGFVIGTALISTAVSLIFKSIEKKEKKKP